MAKKLYRVVESKTGCFGALGTTRRVVDNITNKKTADRKLKELQCSNTNKHIMYWVDFKWAE